MKLTVTDTTEWISLTLTVPTLLLSFMVAQKYGPKALSGLRHKPTSTTLLLLGIAVGFVGSFFDNLYWGFAWYGEAMNLDWKHTAFENGVYSNTVFRQGFGIIAAICHLRAANMISKESE